MATGGRMAVAIDRFAASVGIVPAADGSAPATIGHRWDALRAAGVDDPGLRFARWVDLALVGGVVPPLLANCSDVAALLAALVRFHPLWGDDAVVLERTDVGGARVRLAGPQGAAAHQDTRDAFFALLARMLGQVTTPPVRPTREWHRAGARDVVVFTDAQLAVRLAAADASLASVLTGYAETELDKRAPWLDQVRAEVRADLAAGADLRTIAARLAYSPRTLQQRLTGHATTFSAMVDEERQARALVLLANPALSVTRLALEVGFTSIEGFSRAVRRWTGVSPTEWRKRQSDER